MDWLKAILEKATLKEDGTLDQEALMSAINAEFPKHAVPKKDYNDKVGELKTANDTIDTLKKDYEGDETLQKKISDYELKIGNLEKESADTKKEYALKEKLRVAGVLDADYLIYKQGGLEKFPFDKEGNPIGIDDVLKPYKESSAHLFQSEQKPGGYTPNGGGGAPQTSKGTELAKERNKATESKGPNLWAN